MFKNLSKEDYNKNLTKLLPQGSFWESQSGDSDVSKIIDFLADNFNNFGYLVSDIQAETSPYTAKYTLFYWLILLGGDKNLPQNQWQQEVIRLASQKDYGQLSVYKSIAKSYGLEFISSKPRNDFKLAVCGQYKLGNDSLYAKNWMAERLLTTMYDFGEKPDTAGFETSIRDIANIYYLIKFRHLEKPEEGFEFYLTDGNWVNGIERRYAGFFVKNIPKYQAMYNFASVGKFVDFGNGYSRQITTVVGYDEYLNVSLAGNILNFNDVGYPCYFKILD